MTLAISIDALQHFLANEAGQDMIEYALVAALLGLGAILALKSLATKVGTVFGAVGTALTSAA